MRLQHACAHQRLSLRAVSKKQKYLLNEICTFSFTRRLNVSQNIDLKGEKHGSKEYERWRPRSKRFQSRLDRNGEENCSTEMAGVLLSLQSLLKQLVQVLKAQTEAFNNLREDILLQPDPNEEDNNVLTDTGIHNLLDLTTATNQLLGGLEQRLKSKAPT